MYRVTATSTQVPTELAATEEDEVACRLCGQHYANDMTARFEFAADEDRCSAPGARV